MPADLADGTFPVAVVELIMRMKVARRRWSTTAGYLSQVATALENLAEHTTEPESNAINPRASTIFSVFERSSPPSAPKVVVHTANSSSLPAFFVSPAPNVRRSESSTSECATLAMELMLLVEKETEINAQRCRRATRGSVHKRFSGPLKPPKSPFIAFLGGSPI